MSTLTFADGLVKLDNATLDMILTGLSVNGEVIFDDQPRDGLSGTVKVPMGWSDSDVVASADLITDEAATCYERLAKLNSVFRARDTAPKRFDIVNRHTAARGIRQVVFNSFSSSETDADDVIAVTLGFLEYQPSVVPAEKGEGAATGGIPPKTAADPKPEASIQVDAKS